MTRSLIVVMVVSGNVMLPSCTPASDEHVTVVMIPRTEWVNPAGRFEADFYAIRNLNTAQPRIELSATDTSSRVEIGEDGGLHYSTRAYNWGTNDVSGNLVIAKNGVEERIPFTTRFDVFPIQASLSVSSKYLVRGLANELDYAAAGYREKDVLLMATNGELNVDTEGGFTFWPGEKDTCQIWAVLVNSDGTKVETPRRTFLVVE